MTELHENDRPSKKVKIDYVKSNLFRVIHTDGATAALNPNGNITINLYSQRFSIPEEVIFNLDREGKLTGEGSIPARQGEDIETVVIRELDVLTVMSLETAKDLLCQLQEIVAEYTEKG
jgi:hypothetical protein